MFHHDGDNKSVSRIFSFGATAAADAGSRKQRLRTASRRAEFAATVLDNKGEFEVWGIVNY